MEMSVFEPLVREFEKQEVSYVVVGGVAAVLHGVIRLTLDLDVILDFQQQNVEKAMTIISQLGFKPKIPVNPKDFAVETTRNSWIAEKHMRVLSFYLAVDPLVELDIFVEHPIPYAELLSQSGRVEFREGELINVCSIEHLLKMKRVSGRSKDLEDIKKLEEIQRAGLK